MADEELWSYSVSAGNPMIFFMHCGMHLSEYSNTIISDCHCIFIDRNNLYSDLFCSRAIASSLASCVVKLVADNSKILRLVVLHRPVQSSGDTIIIDVRVLILGKKKEIGIEISLLY